MKLPRPSMLWLRNLSRVAFGELRWSPPAWVRSAGDAARRFQALVRAQPRRSAAILAAALLVTLASVLGWRWYQSLPKPLEFSVTVAAPERTCIECDPPGKPNPVVLNFTGSVAPLEVSGKDIDPAKAGVSIQPAIAGRVASGRTITR